MEIRGGVGGEEGMLFAADLFRMYSMYAESKRFSIEVMNINETEIGGIKEVIYLSDKYHDTMLNLVSKRMLSAAGVKFTQLKTTVKSITLDFTPEEEK